MNGVDAHQHRAGCRKVAFDKGQVLDRLRRRLVDMQIELPPAAVSTSAWRLATKVVLQPVIDEVRDGADLQAVGGRSVQVRHARHGAVVVHDLADDAGRVQPGQARQVDGTSVWPVRTSTPPRARSGNTWPGEMTVVRSASDRGGDGVRAVPAEMPVVMPSRASIDSEGGAEARPLAPAGLQPQQSARSSVRVRQIRPGRSAP